MHESGAAQPMVRVTLPADVYAVIDQFLQAESGAANTELKNAISMMTWVATAGHYVQMPGELSDMALWVEDGYLLDIETPWNNTPVNATPNIQGADK